MSELGTRSPATKLRREVKELRRVLSFRIYRREDLHDAQMAAAMCSGSVHADAHDRNNGEGCAASPSSSPRSVSIRPWTLARAAPGSSHQGTDKPSRAARRRSHL